MTDRINGLTIILERDIREDDAEEIITAISMIRGVQSISKIVTDASTKLAEMKAREDIKNEILKFVLENGMQAVLSK